jgi:hypothetical protein
MIYSKYINDKSQTDLSLQQLSKKDKLIKYRELLYIDMLNKINDLENQKKIIIAEYKVNIAEIDKELNKNE